MEDQTPAPDTTAPQSGETIREKPDRSLVPQLKPYQWQKGQSGNPAGGPKRNGDAIKTAKQYAEDAVKMLWAMAKDPKMPAETRRKACNDLLDRGFGKVTKTIAVKPGQLDAATGPDSALSRDMLRFIEDAQASAPVPQPVEILPPLDADPFAIDLRQYDADAGQNIEGGSLKRGARTAAAVQSQKMRDAFNYGVALGQELSDDED